MTRGQIILRYVPGECSMLTLAREYKVNVGTVSKLIRKAGGNCARRADPANAYRATV